MAVTAHQSLLLYRGVLQTKWLAVPNGNQGSAEAVGAYPDKSVQVEGTFGTGGSVTIQGSNDGGTTWETLHDPLGAALTFTAAGLKQVLEGVDQIRPTVTAGDGTTSLNISMVARSAMR